MVTLYITRHGQTEWNTQQRIQGWFDSPLTAYGQKQSKALCKRLSKTPFIAAYSSPSGRALDTAKFILDGHQTPLFIKPGIKEINVAEWQGMTLPAIAEKYPTQYEQYFHHPENFTSNEGENFYDVRTRAQKVIDTIIDKYDEEDNVLIVTHSIVKRVLINAFSNESIEHLWDTPSIEGTSLTIVRYEKGTYHIQAVGDVEHLPEDRPFCSKMGNGK
ncbi:histidine phosphatase family protein [Kurthia senegalensis]|uniref:histidine phosphatase family protein n=1 Tax=Kurthia senegalensis TaxID=1033740 RepID=UPI000289FFED|nr:histidine phosphatase family protein [Kurthia senegalensis]